MTSAITSTSPQPSPLYLRLQALARIHAQPSSVQQLLSIRHPSAVHTWGHVHLVQQNPGLQERMSNAQFAAHLASTGHYLTSTSSGTIHSIIVDEYVRRAVVHMSYFLTPAASLAEGGEQKPHDFPTVEQDLIWLLVFTAPEEGEEVLIKHSVEFIDASASASVGTAIRSIHGEITEDVRGGITLHE